MSFLFVVVVALERPYRRFMVAVFISGFSGTSAGTVPGTAGMAASPAIGLAVRGGSTALTWTDHGAAVAAITSALAINPCQPVIVVGHSLGGDTAVEVCDLLWATGICVDLLVQIESVGWFDDVVPAGVRAGLNLFSPGSGGEPAVAGATNVAIGGTTHTAIDEDPAPPPPTPPPAVGAATTPGPYLGMNAWQIVAAAIAGITGPPWCNCKCPAATTPGMGVIPGGTTPGGTTPGGTTPGGTAPSGTAPGGTTPGGTVVPGHGGGHHDPREHDPRTHKLRGAIMRFLGEALEHDPSVPFRKLSAGLGLAPEKIVRPLRTLIADGSLHEVPGATAEPWLAMGPVIAKRPPGCQLP